ncbi:RasGEF domain protein [Necator americanus]|uniref:RasGEF domain protein n=1 Tax=Necator americanus TaxID=51031 RepID=W2SXT6_NECAM|nr:RasGEF domain protein [Necator americanus]ETN74338.1 RasGEF domain protein [Necator americanus]
MLNIQEFVQIPYRVSTASSTTTEGDDASGSAGADPVDSEEEDDDGSCPSHESFVDLKDSVRECLEKEPTERNNEDLAVLLDFMQHMSSFASLPMSIKRQLCLKMVFAVVNDAGTVVMHHNEKLDAWSVIVNGLVEVVKPNGERVEYKLGDSFGAEPNPAVQYHVGEMRTMVDDCEFVLVEHKDFCSIMSTIGEHIEKDRDGLTGEIVSETERRTVGSQVGLVLIKGKPDKLIQHLVDDRDSNVDPHYVDDFLLTYRVFIHNPVIIFEKLMMWFADGALRDKIARIVLLWVNNHYNDFETNDEMTKLLERFEGALERDGMHSQQSLLNIACSVKARSRTVVYSRANKVQVDSPAERCGMKRGDEILDVNGQPMKYLTLMKAQEIMKGSISLTITLKSNILGFKELLGRTERDGSKISSKNRALAGALTQARGSMPNVIPVKSTKAVKIGGKTSMMDKLMTILKSSKDGEDLVDEARTTTSPLRPSRSNPDITSISQYYGPVKSECPEHVLKIYRSDQTFKYLAVYKETTAQNVVQLALQVSKAFMGCLEFNMTAEGSLEWSLCECTVTEDGVIKQRRLPAQMENLAERIALNSRYYLKNNNRSEPLVPDDLAPEIMRDAQAQLLSLNAQVVAAQLTLQDFAVFASIEPTEYIDNLFQLESRYGSPRLEEFERIFNREMWWVATEVCSERVIQKRAKLIKKFIKVARYCRELRNFNSMFAIMSGLDKPAVRRLHSTWERISGKYIRMLEDIQQLVDPSRNMSKYRQHLAEVSQEPPVVPIYPVIKKDLTFSHEGNPTYCDKLVNFEKLRLIAKSVRAVSKLSSAPYEISSMAERSGGTISDALLHMNTFEGGNVATMRKGGRVIQPRKKVYEQALMVRKVKAYLDGLKVVDTESELDRLSYDIEPQQAGPRIRRAPSPSPSSVSSQSAESNSTDQRRFRGGIMFGVDSPQAVQKMLGLVQTSKSKDPSKKRSFPISTKPPTVPVTVVQPSRYAQ